MTNVEIYLTTGQYCHMPQAAQKALRSYGRECPQGMGMPSKIVVATEDMFKIADAFGDEFPEIANTYRAMGTISGIAYTK